MFCSTSAAKSTLRSGFNPARGNFYIGLLNVPKRHPGDICMFIINFTSIPGHVKYLIHVLQHFCSQVNLEERA